MKDKKILLYAGTTEGRKLASYLGRRGVRLHVCVATAYGESLLPEEKNITVTHDRMDSGQMGEFMRVFEPDYVIDATHPYAKEVTKNLKSACEVMQVPYLRLVRGCLLYTSVKNAGKCPHERVWDTGIEKNRKYTEFCS